VLAAFVTVMTASNRRQDVADITQPGSGRVGRLSLGLDSGACTLNWQRFAIIRCALMLSHSSAGLSTNEPVAHGQRGFRPAALALDPLVIAAALIVMGAAFRVAAWWRTTSFWDDEVFLLLNVVEHSFLGLLRPLDLEQSAPIGFLWAERAAYQVFGAGELSLRLYPLLTGIALLIVVWGLCREVIGPYAALVAVACISFAPFCIRYSAEAKPYGPDALITALLLYAAQRWLHSGGETTYVGWGLTARLAALGTAALLCSLASCFVLAGIGALAYVSACRGRRCSAPETGRLFLVAAIWLSVFIPLFRLASPPETLAYMRQYWAFSYVTVQPSLSEALRTMVMNGLVSPLFSLEESIPVWLQILAVLLMVCGISSFVRSRRIDWLTLTLVPLIVVFVAAVFRWWVFSPRLMMFLVPIVALLVAAGAAEVTRMFRLGTYAIHPNTAVLAIIAILIAFPAKASFWYVRHPVREHIRGCVDYALAKQQKGDVLYIYSRALPGWMYYTTDWSSPDRERVAWFHKTMAAIGPNSGNIPPRGYAVSGEGHSFRRRWRGGEELAGGPEGILRTHAQDPARVDPPPDPGWTDNEVRRMQQAANSVGASGRVILVGFYNRRGISELVAHLDQHRAKPLDSYDVEGNRVLIYDLRGSSPR
jgi:hypothetical protein